nr:immunoglobulin heavy chain junction region [Macaca mulatta]
CTRDLGYYGSRYYPAHFDCW